MIIVWLKSKEVVMTISKLGTLWGFSLDDLGRLKSKVRKQKCVVFLLDVLLVAVLGYISYRGIVHNTNTVLTVVALLAILCNMLLCSNTSELLAFIDKYKDKELVLEKHYLYGGSIEEMVGYLNAYCSKSILTADSFIKQLKPSTVLVDCWVLNVKNRKYIIAVDTNVSADKGIEELNDIGDTQCGIFEKEEINE
jgi:hypothetical protein